MPKMDEVGVDWPSKNLPNQSNLLLMSGGVYKAGDLVVVGRSQDAREGSLREPGLRGPALSRSSVPSWKSQNVVANVWHEIGQKMCSTFAVVHGIMLAYWSMVTSSQSAVRGSSKMLQMYWSTSRPSRFAGLLKKVKFRYRNKKDLGFSRRTYLQTGHCQRPLSPLTLR